MRAGGEENTKILTLSAASLLDHTWLLQGPERERAGLAVPALWCKVLRIRAPCMRNTGICSLRSTFRTTAWSML